MFVLKNNTQILILKKIVVETSKRDKVLITAMS